MRLTTLSSVAVAAACVADALVRTGIRVVLTGGACASPCSAWMYQSADLDFVLRASVTRRELEAFMAATGFRRSSGRCQHLRTRFFVEFPDGALGIGDDNGIRPVVLRTEGISLRSLSAMDS